MSEAALGSLSFYNASDMLLSCVHIAIVLPDGGPRDFGRYKEREQLRNQSLMMRCLSLLLAGAISPGGDASHDAIFEASEVPPGLHVR